MTEAQILTGAIAGTKLAVFFLFLLFLYMTHNASETLDLRVGYVIGASLLVVALAEFSHVLAMTRPDEAVVPWLNDLGNLTLLSEIFYLIAGIAAVVFFKGYRASIRDDGG